MPELAVLPVLIGSGCHCRWSQNKVFICLKMFCSEVLLSQVVALIVPFPSTSFLICRHCLLHELSVRVGSNASPARNFHQGLSPFALLESGCLSPSLRYVGSGMLECTDGGCGCGLAP